MRPTTLCVLMLLPALTACGSKTEERLKTIEARLAKVEQAADAHKAITLKPGGSGYSMIDGDMGRIAVAIANIEPYASGSRVVLDFGNPTAARLSGLKAKIEWGSNDAKGLPMAATSTQSLLFTAPEPLPPGSWKQYTVDLAGVPPTQLGWVRVSGFDNGTVDLLSQ
jgi:hypothetical protein